MKSMLLVFGWAFVIWTLTSIAVRYFWKRQDLLTSWNLFLLGSVNFIGISAIHAGSATRHSYGFFDDSDYLRFICGALVFYTVAPLTYWSFKFPRRIAASVLHKWAPQSIPVLLMLLGVSIVTILGNWFVPNIQFIGQILILLGIYGSVFSLVFCFVAWHRQRWNPVLLLLLIPIFLLATVVALQGAGRRDLLSVMLAIPICLYWLKWRYQSPAKLVVPAVLAVALTVVAIGGYSVVRWSQRSRYEHRAVTAWELAKAIPSAFSERGTASGLLGGDAVQASLAAIRHYTRDAEPQPFFTIAYALSNPIPRAWWPDKIEAVGVTLPRDTGWTAGRGRINWGIGVVGHGYHEGGLHMLVFYGFLFGACFRFFDELLARHSGNAFLLGTFSAISGHILAFSRGDVGLFVVLILGGLGTGLVFNWVARFLFGTEVAPALAPIITLEPAAEPELQEISPRASWGL